MLTARASAVLDALDANFKTLASLHEEAVKEGDANVVTSIAAGVASHRNTVVNWRSKNKRIEVTGRKRSATDPLDEGSIRGWRKRHGSKELGSREGLRSGGGGRCVSSDRLKNEGGEASGGGDRLKSKDGASVRSEDGDRMKSGSGVRSESSGSIDRLKSEGGVRSGCGDRSNSEGGAGVSSVVTESTDRSRSGEKGVGITLDAKDVEEAKELVQKLMSYFSQ